MKDQYRAKSPGFYVRVPVRFQHKFEERTDHAILKNTTKCFTRRPDLRQSDEYFNQVRMSSSGEMTRECTWMIFCQSSTIL